MLKLNVEKIYIAHYTKLIDRKTNLDNIINKFNTQIEFYCDFDKEYLNEEIINEYYLYDEKKFNETIRSVYKNNCHYRKMSLSEISLAIKHYNILNKISNECNEYGLVLEDDVIFCDDFIKKFNEYLLKTPDNWDVIYLGSCCNLKVPKEQLITGQIAYLKDHPASKCADSFLIKKNMAKKISSSMKPFCTMNDFEISYHFFLHDAKIYWWEPSLIVQGSENGKFKSSLR